MTSLSFLRNLAQRAVLSIYLFVMLAFGVAAHEIDPGIADVSVGMTDVEIQLELSLESILAELDLAASTETTGADGEEEYNRLRALAPDELEAELELRWANLSERIIIEVAGTQVVPELVSAEIPEIGDFELARTSVLTMMAMLPEGDDPVQFGWAALYGDLVVRQANGGDDAYSAFLIDGALSEPLPRGEIVTEGSGAVFLRYIFVGFDHIIPKGLDHILFVLGLFFFALKVRPIISQVTAFTVAHTITLALASLDIVTVPGSVVEPLIALSIVYVGVENILGWGNLRNRTALVFGFGLLHGLGFASVLEDFGLGSHFIAGLLGFNVGVEVGQLAVILAAFLIVGLWFGKKDWYRPMIAVPASAVIAAIGLYWSIERVFF